MSTEINIIYRNALSAIYLYNINLRPTTRAPDTTTASIRFCISSFAPLIGFMATGAVPGNPGRGSGWDGAGRRNDQIARHKSRPAPY